MDMTLKKTGALNQSAPATAAERSILEAAEKHPWKAGYFGQKLADLHLACYRTNTGTDWPDFRCSCIEDIGQAKRLSDAEKENALEVLEQFPREKAFSHIDLQSGDIILADTGLQPKLPRLMRCDHYLLETANTVVNFRYRDGMHLSKAGKGYDTVLQHFMLAAYLRRLRWRYPGKFPLVLLKTAMIPLLYLKLDKARSINHLRQKRIEREICGIIDFTR